MHLIGYPPHLGGFSSNPIGQIQDLGGDVPLSDGPGRHLDSFSFSSSSVRCLRRARTLSSCRRFFRSFVAKEDRKPGGASTRFRPSLRHKKVVLNQIESKNGSKHIVLYLFFQFQEVAGLWRSTTCTLYSVQRPNSRM